MLAARLVPNLIAGKKVSSVAAHIWRVQSDLLVVPSWISLFGGASIEAEGFVFIILPPNPYPTEVLSVLTVLTLHEFSGCICHEDEGDIPAFSLCWPDLKSAQISDSIY